MENAIKLAEAIGWPIAATLIAFSALAIVIRVTAARGEFSVGIKDWFKFGTKATPETGDLPKA